MALLKQRFIFSSFILVKENCDRNVAHVLLILYFA